MALGFVSNITIYETRRDSVALAGGTPGRVPIDPARFWKVSAVEEAPPSTRFSKKRDYPPHHPLLERRVRPVSPNSFRLMGPVTAAAVMSGGIGVVSRGGGERPTLAGRALPPYRSPGVTCCPVR